jgi:hypothetical protein
MKILTPILLFIVLICMFCSIYLFNQNYSAEFNQYYEQRDLFNSNLYILNNKMEEYFTDNYNIDNASGNLNTIFLSSTFNREYFQKFSIIRIELTFSQKFKMLKYNDLSNIHNYFCKIIKDNDYFKSHFTWFNIIFKYSFKENNKHKTILMKHETNFKEEYENQTEIFNY